MPVETSYPASDLSSVGDQDLIKGLRKGQIREVNNYLLLPDSDPNTAG